MRLFVITLALALITSQPAYALEGDFSLSVGVDYSSGDYGASQDTDVLATPVSIKYRADKWSLRVSTSYLRVTGPSFVTPEGDFLGDDAGGRVTDKGIGDVNISASYNLLDERDFPFGMDVIARVKIPTADEDKFLGTGETDYALNAEIFQGYGNWTPYLNVGYRWRGDQPDRTLKDVWSTSFGTDYRVNKTLSLGLSYFWQERVSNFVDNVEEASTYLSYKINQDNRVNFYVVHGFSDASPDWGAGTTFTHYF